MIANAGGQVHIDPACKKATAAVKQANPARIID
jgi:hypothetical protein